MPPFPPSVHGAWPRDSVGHCGVQNGGSSSALCNFIAHSSRCGRHGTRCRDCCAIGAISMRGDDAHASEPVLVYGTKREKLSAHACILQCAASRRVAVIWR